MVATKGTVASLMDTWPEWKEKLIHLAKLDSGTRPMIKRILEKLERQEQIVYPDGKLKKIM